jgi:hypothetical protein
VRDLRLEPRREHGWRLDHRPDRHRALQAASVRAARCRATRGRTGRATEPDCALAHAPAGARCRYSFGSGRRPANVRRARTLQPSIQ